MSNTGVERRPVIGVALGSFVTHRDGQAILKSAVIGRANDALPPCPTLSIRCGVEKAGGAMKIGHLILASLIAFVPKISSATTGIH